MKAIILAAGKGTRLDKYTHDMPKCMLNFAGKTLIQRQVETLQACGIKNISAVTGYMKEKININGIKYYHNPEYEITNMVASLFCAEEEMADDIIVCYGDIIYEKHVLEKVISSKFDIGVTVDEDYLDYWKVRLDNWQEDMESLVIGTDGSVKEIGIPKCSIEKAKFRYVGLIRFSREGIKALKRIFYKYKAEYWENDKKFMNSKSFKKLYMTDMMQLLINSNYKVYPIIIKRGWLEFDTNEDYEKSTEWLKNGTLGRFFNAKNE